jgi:hypothetical protein
MKTLSSHAGYSVGAEFHRRTAADKLTSSGDTHSFDGGRYDGIGAQDDSAHFVQLPESTVTVGRDRDLVIQCRVRGHPRPKGKIKFYLSNPSSGQNVNCKKHSSYLSSYT